MNVTPHVLLKEVLEFYPDVYIDDRGHFLETFNDRTFREALKDHCPRYYSIQFVQDNESYSVKSVIRGLHYQIPKPQGKLVRCSWGSVFDVAVDFRKNSTTFGLWTSAILTAKLGNQLWIPPGFAHGFCVVSEDAKVNYKATDYYCKEAERYVIWNDLSLNIEWPKTINDNPILSPKDLSGLSFEKAEKYD